MPEIQLGTYVARIQDLIETGRQNEAITHCKQILHSYPRFYRAYHLLGQACLANRLYAEARDFFQRALSADPENLDAWLGLGRAYGEQAMLKEATWAVEQALELAPGSEVVGRELLGLYGRRQAESVAGSQEPQERARLRLTRGGLGRLYMRSGWYDQAIGELEFALENNPRSPVTHIALGEALWRGGRDLKATQSCLETLTVLPDCLKAHLILAEVWLRGKDPHRAQARLEAARALDPENVMAQQMMGEGSPLPTAEVLIQTATTGNPTQAAARVPPAEQSVEAVPIWARELEQM